MSCNNSSKQSEPIMCNAGVPPQQTNASFNTSDDIQIDPYNMSGKKKVSMEQALQAYKAARPLSRKCDQCSTMIQDGGTCPVCSSSADNQTMVVFDMDGTLADRDTAELLEGRQEWFQKNEGRFKYALATNQGGVAIAHLKESRGESRGKFPNQKDVENHVGKVQSALGTNMPTYKSYAFKDRDSGEWIVPEGEENNPSWNESYRKPKGGMIEAAVADQNHTGPVVYIGDRSEDVSASLNANASFASADEFFSQR